MQRLCWILIMLMALGCGRPAPTDTTSTSVAPGMVPGGALPSTAAGLVGNWAGNLEVDTSAVGIPRPDSAVPLPVQFSCSADGKVRLGYFGITIPYEYHAGNVGAFGLQQFDMTATSLVLTTYKLSPPDLVMFQGDPKYIPPHQIKFRFQFQAAGEEIDTILHVAENNGTGPLEYSPVFLRGRLRRQ